MSRQVMSTGYDTKKAVAVKAEFILLNYFLLVHFLQTEKPARTLEKLALKHICRSWSRWYKSEPDNHDVYHHVDLHRSDAVS